MAKDILGFGVIGCGSISNCHIGSILQMSDARLVGVTDINKNAREHTAEKYNIQVYDSAEELVRSKDVDIVCICTPSGLHAPMAILAANAGKHLIIEKPLALNLNEVDNIARACVKSNVKATVIFQLRYSDGVKTVKNIIEKGFLG